MTEGWDARRTVLSSVSDGFVRPESGLALVGVLTPVSSKSQIPQFRIDQPSLLIGRGQASDGVDLSVKDDNVSRRHARITRVGDQFILEDLNSSNGTFVDGVPIRAVRLEDGDTIQIGRSLVYFDHLFEFEDEQPAPSSQMSLTDWFGRRDEVGKQDVMSLRFWGTRGSLPTPGAETRKYGGNTTCVELRYNDDIVVLDAGSGIREMSKYWFDEFGPNPINASLCFTHLHWDHIQGFPFFGAAYVPHNKIQIYGARRQAGTTKELLSAQMQGDYFPIPISAMQAQLDFFDTEKNLTIGSFSVETFDLPHPNDSLGYRFTAGDSVFVMATDSELDQVALNQKDVEANFQAKREYDPEFLKPFRDADLLLIDCQYSDEEYLGKKGWGHNSIAAVVDLCEQVQPKMVALSHHDPMSNDQVVTERVKEAVARLHERGIENTLAFGAREQMSVSVGAPKRPSRI